jgi:hypothetical protein
MLYSFLEYISILKLISSPIFTWDVSIKVDISILGSKLGDCATKK